MRSDDFSDLEIEFSDLIHELKDLYDELGFLRSQEIMKKKEVWSADQNASIQVRDRTASYAAAEITAEIYKVEARIHSVKASITLCQYFLHADERQVPPLSDN